MFQKSFLLSCALLLVLMFLSLIVKPFLIKRAAVNVVKTVLKQWKNGDQIIAQNQWLDEQQYPSIYDLKNFRFIYKEISKHKRTRYAKIDVLLNFNSTGVLPSGERWRFSLTKTPFGWKVDDFYLINHKVWDYDPVKNLRKPQSNNQNTTIEKEPTTFYFPEPSPPDSSQPLPGYKRIPAALD